MKIQQKVLIYLLDKHWAAGRKMVFGALIVGNLSVPAALLTLCVMWLVNRGLKTALVWA